MFQLNVEIRTIQIHIYGRNLRTFEAMNSLKKYSRFLLFLCLLLTEMTDSIAQKLTKTQVERRGNDGLMYVFEGMLDDEGQLIIPANYDYIWAFQDTLTLARKRVDTGNEDDGAFVYQIITKSGFLNYEFPDYLVPESLSEGIILTWNKQLQSFGFVDTKGDVIIKFDFDDAKEFSDGLAAVKKRRSSSWGFIDKKGKFVVEPIYDEAFSFSEKQAVVRKDGKHAYISTSGGLINIPNSYLNVFDLQEGKSIVTNLSGDTIKYGFIDASGKEILKPNFDFIDNFEENTAVFVQKSEAGMLSADGKILIPARYDEIYRFDQSHYLFQQNGLQGLVKIDGTQVLPARYSAIGLFHEGLCAVKQSGLWGFANTAGELVIPCQFSEINSTFENGKASVQKPDIWYLVQGNDTLKLPAYDEVLPYYGYCAAFRIGGLWGFLNQNGEESIEPKYDELVFNKGSVVFARSTTQDGSFIWSVVDAHGREVQTEKYNEVVRFSDGFAAVRKKDKWGFINHLGAEIIPPQYDYVRNFSSGKVAVSKDSQWGFLGKNGREEIPILQNFPSIDEEIGATQKDTVDFIRQSFPLYLMQVIGDFNGNFACLEDLTFENATANPVCINKVGKLVTTVECNPYTKVAELFDPEAEQNLSLRVVRKLGSWATIDTEGKFIN
jgi:hypothetical protein